MAVDNEAHLLAALSGSDTLHAKRALRQAARAGSAAVELALRHFEHAAPPLRGRLCALVGRVAQETRDPRTRDFLVKALGDADAKVRRNAAIALGKLQGPEAESALLTALARETDEPQRRAIVASLGKSGTGKSREALAALETSDAESARVLAEARLKLERDERRAQPSEIDARARPRRPVEILLHCRAGLEPLLASELDESFAARVASRATVRARLEGPLESVLRSRILLWSGFPLPAPPAHANQPLEARVVQALTSQQARELFRTFTRGVLRYRLEWEGAGHLRGLTYAVARQVSERCPELVNDPTGSPWQVRVSQETDELRIELCPRKMADPRFDYRVADVPAASHPTIAAALARVAGARGEDIVWDPFVGSGLELVERGLLGPYARLLGSDRDEAALAAAEQNLKAAGLARYSLRRADALDIVFSNPVDLIITNPPFGRRVRLDGHVAELYRRLLERASQVLSKRGRFVWMSPLFEESVAMAEQVGLRPEFRRRVDMGGFQAELQLFVRAERTVTRPPSARPRRAPR